MIELDVAPTLILPVVSATPRAAAFTSLEGCLGPLRVPLSRGSAPALTLAAIHALSADDPVLLATLSHRVASNDALAPAIARGAALAARGFAVAFGWALDAATEGDGCIRADGRVGKERAVEAHYIEAFEDEPPAGEARGRLWNSGLYAVRASVWIDAIGYLRRDILTACERGFRAAQAKEGRLDAAALADCPAASIRAAVMERIAGTAIGPGAVVVRI